jgi:hypothetical protein
MLTMISSSSVYVYVVYLYILYRLSVVSEDIDAHYSFVKGRV